MWDTVLVDDESDNEESDRFYINATESTTIELWRYFKLKTNRYFGRSIIILELNKKRVTNTSKLGKSVFMFTLKLNNK